MDRRTTREYGGAVSLVFALPSIARAHAQLHPLMRKEPALQV